MRTSSETEMRRGSTPRDCNRRNRAPHGVTQVTQGCGAPDIMKDVAGYELNKVAEADFPTRWGQFRIMGFEGHGPMDRRTATAVALVMGHIRKKPPMARI